MLAALALQLALAPPSAVTVVAGAHEIALLRLVAVGLDAAALTRAIELRIPEIRVVDHADADALLSSDQLYVRVSHEPGGPLRVEVIAADGRTYDRGVDPGTDQPERVAAATIANLVFAIEAGALTPSRLDGAIPGTDAVPEPEVAAPISVEAPTQTNDATPPLGRRLGVGASLGAVLGPGVPVGADVFAGWSGAVALAIRGPRGGLGRLRLRGAGRRAGDYGLARLQVAVGGGVVRSVASLELEVVGALTIEPWWVTRGGAREATSRGGVARSPWLLGGELRAALGHRFTGGGGSWRVGPWLGLAGAFTVVDGVGVPRVVDVAGDPLFRVGAFELGGGFECVGWFALARRRRG